jgi:ATP-dependent Clp endopeptidase proteolytic subunit ClpP
MNIVNRKFRNADISFEPDGYGEGLSLAKESVCETVDNRIYFYSDIEREQILTLNKRLRELSNDLVIRQINEESNDQKIFLHINSAGGDVFMGFSAMDEILKSKIPVYTIIDGCCASSATFLSIVGKKRFINKHAFILIHQLSSSFEGKYNEFNDHKTNIDQFMEMMKNIYLTYTKLDDDKIKELINKDLWLNAEDALKYGFVDEIL